MLKLVGVTGTNGKTTTSSLVDSICARRAAKTGLFGTIAYRTPRERLSRAEHHAGIAGPAEIFRRNVRAGGTHAVLEASSHALALDRLWGCPFAVAIFTNLTRDHLDYHKTFEDYFAAKRRLFEGTGAGAPGCGVINATMNMGKNLWAWRQRTLTYGLEPGADVTTTKIHAFLSGLEFTAETPNGKIEVRSKLVGRTNVYNILAAIGAARRSVFPAKSSRAGIAQLHAVPGRFERIEVGQPFLVIVDYAHTDDALRNLLGHREGTESRWPHHHLFGCGGDRDRTKRPLMGEAAGRRANCRAYRDNPRSEDPLLIINDVIVGVQRTPAKYLVEPDREKAIEMALDEARAGDIVLLAGKGHENYQVLRDRTIEFDDREVARQVLRERGLWAARRLPKVAANAQGLAPSALVPWL